MKRFMGYAVVAVASIAGTIAFMVSCSSGNDSGGGTGGGSLFGGPPSAKADTPSSCTQWQVTYFDTYRLCPSVIPSEQAIDFKPGDANLGTPCPIPAGWEPITSDDQRRILVRRCAQ